MLLIVVINLTSSVCVCVGPLFTPGGFDKAALFLAAHVESFVRHRKRVVIVVIIAVVSDLQIV